MSNTCFAGIRKVTSHSERNSMILASSLGRMFWTAWSAGSISGTCAVVGTPTVRLAYSSAKKSRHILETHWLGFSISIVIFARGHGLAICANMPALSALEALHTTHIRAAILLHVSSLATLSTFHSWIFVDCGSVEPQLTLWIPFPLLFGTFVARAPRGIWRQATA